jgi:hypothetical protein
MGFPKSIGLMQLRALFQYIMTTKTEIYTGITTRKRTKNQLACHLRLSSPSTASMTSSRRVGE